MKINYEILVRKVKKHYPHIYEELILIPEVMDFNYINTVFDYFVSIGKNPRKIGDNKLIFIAVIVKLYDPDVFSGDKKNLRNGLRAKLAMVLHSEPSTISHGLKTSKNYFEIYVLFREEVNTIICALHSKFKGH